MYKTKIYKAKIIFFVLKHYKSTLAEHFFSRNMIKFPIYLRNKNYEYTVVHYRDRQKPPKESSKMPFNKQKKMISKYYSNFFKALNCLRRFIFYIVK